MGDEEESKQIKDPVGQYIPPGSLLAARPSLNRSSTVPVQDQEQQGNMSEVEQDENLTSESSSDTSVNPANEVEITSCMAFDRFSSLGAYGYSNGMIKLFRVFEPATELRRIMKDNKKGQQSSMNQAKPGEYRESEIIGAHTYEVI